MHEALYYSKESNSQVKCLLCPHKCRIGNDKSGICKVRQNRKGVLYTKVYDRVAALHVDPIEKKPLYHFYPGKNILSIGQVGCNFHCSFCQNSSISQCYPDKFTGFTPINSNQIVDHTASIKNNIGVAYTYNEPFTFYEFMLDCAQKVHEAGLKNVVVSNGFINQKPLENILPFIDAFNIDLKAFNSDFYKKYVKGDLKPVMESIKLISKSNKHLEITNLVITDHNDKADEFETMVKWIANETGKDTPLHISRYFPNYEMTNPPTPVSKLEFLYSIAIKHLNYVYLGNVFDEMRSSTYCPNCNSLLIGRGRYRIIKEINNNICKTCGSKIKIVY